ncbi:MAG: sigma 54-interacting transcriptional regulator [Candidatus Stygibacter frigidus]|nr:sigma 54-interacting transcriptional regulator [Candidatus Stygibacter frigidus]
MVSNEELTRLTNELHSVRNSGDRDELIQALGNMISAYSRSNKIFEAIPFALELNSLLQEKGDSLQLAKNYDFLGRIYTYVPDYEKSEHYTRLALKIYQDNNKNDGQFYCYHSLGMVYRRKGNFSQSLEFLFKAKEFMELHLKDTDNQRDSYFLGRISGLLEQIGMIYGMLKQPEKAREYLKLALKHAREVNDAESICKELINLGVSYSDEDTELALQYYLEALPLAKANGKINVLAALKNNIGGVYEDRGEYDKALEYYRRALEIAEKSKMLKNLTYFLKHIGTVYYKQKKYEEALEYALRSLEETEKNQQIQEIEENYLLLSNICKAQQKYQKSLEYYEQYTLFKDKRLNSEVIEKIANIQKKYEATISKLVKTERKSSLISESLKNQINMNFIGNSHAIKEVHKLALMAAEHCDTNVLITGESGTGKEIIAHIIHFASRRNDNIFIPINCSSIPENLSESEFFGHKKGAFTGAIADKIGYLEDASSGTLFLDEIGEMPLHLQAKLLRVLETKIVKPIGTNKSIKVDFRLIAATNNDISKLIGENLFRVDLFYRINTIQIHIPPLRDRRADIEPLTHFFVSSFAKILKKPVPRITQELIESLREYHFPGNVRELKNMVERAMIMLKTDTLGIESFNLTQAPAITTDQSSITNCTIEEMEKQMIINTLDQTGNNLTHTAKKLGISYSTLNRKIKTYQLK